MDPSRRRLCALGSGAVKEQPSETASQETAQYMTNLKIFDSHIHVWNLETQRLDWLHGVDSLLHRSFSFADLKQAYADLAEQGLADVELAGALHIEADVADPADEDARITSLMSHEPLLPQVLSECGKYCITTTSPAGAA